MRRRLSVSVACGVVALAVVGLVWRSRWIPGAPDTAPRAPTEPGPSQGIVSLPDRVESVAPDATEWVDAPNSGPEETVIFGVVVLKESGAEGTKPVDKLTIKPRDVAGKENEVVVLSA